MSSCRSSRVLLLFKFLGISVSSFLRHEMSIAPYKSHFCLFLLINISVYFSSKYFLKTSLIQKKLKRGEAWVAHEKNCCLKVSFSHWCSLKLLAPHLSVLIVPGHTNLTNCQHAFSHFLSLLLHLYHFVCSESSVCKTGRTLTKSPNQLLF